MERVVWRWYQPLPLYLTNSAPSQVPGLYSNSDPKTRTNCLYWSEGFDCAFQTTNENLQGAYSTGFFIPKSLWLGKSCLPTDSAIAVLSSSVRKIHKLGLGYGYPAPEVRSRRGKEKNHSPFFGLCSFTVWWFRPPALCPEYSLHGVPARNRGFYPESVIVFKPVDIWWHVPLIPVLRRQR